jgi:hypothetical protein
LAAFVGGPLYGADHRGDAVVRLSDAGADDAVVRVSDASAVELPPPAAPIPTEPTYGPPMEHMGAPQGVYEPMTIGPDGTVCEHCPQYGMGASDVIFDDGLSDGFHLFNAGARPNRRGWLAGGGVVSLEADFDANTAFFIQDSTGAADVITNEEFGFDLESGFRTWIGWQDGTGLAYRVSYFDWDTRATESAVAPADFVFFNGLETPTTIGRLLAGGTAGDVINAEAELEIYYIDAEISQELNFNRWQTTFGGGYRHIGMSQQYFAAATAGGIPVTSEVGQRFDGDGPTAFAEVRLPFLGYRDRRYIGSANVSLFSHGRASVLFGDSKLSATDINPTLPGVTVATAELEDSDSVKICELRVGAQFDVRPVDGSLIYVIVAYEGQWLDGANDFGDVNEDNDLVLRGWYFALGADW